MSEEESRTTDKLKQDAKAYVAFQRAIDRDERWFTREFHAAFRARKRAEKIPKPETPTER